MAEHSKLSDFVVLERIGKGAYGVVYKVKRKVDSALYVLKKIHLTGLDRAAQQDAINEVTILSSLDHRNVIKYYDSFVENDDLNIIMELAEKGTLHSFLKRQNGKRLTEEVIWQHFLPLLAGVEHIHSKKVLHRDLKSMNIFLSEKDVVKIGDLGVAKVMGSMRHFAHTVVGTPYYLSPELCENKPYNEKSDIWALGCILYEMCTLRHPFDAANQGALVLKIIRGRFPQVPSSYSPDLRKLVTDLLTRDQARRPGLENILGREAVRSKAQLCGVNLNRPNIPAVRPYPSAARASNRPQTKIRSGDIVNSQLKEKGVKERPAQVVKVKHQPIKEKALVVRRGVTQIQAKPAPQIQTKPTPQIQTKPTPQIQTKPTPQIQPNFGRGGRAPIPPYRRERPMRGVGKKNVREGVQQPPKGLKRVNKDIDQFIMKKPFADEEIAVVEALPDVVIAAPRSKADQNSKETKLPAGVYKPVTGNTPKIPIGRRRSDLAMQPRVNTQKQLHVESIDVNVNTKVLVGPRSSSAPREKITLASGEFDEGGMIRKSVTEDTVGVGPVDTDNTSSTNLKGAGGLELAHGEFEDSAAVAARALNNQQSNKLSRSISEGSGLISEPANLEEGEIEEELEEEEEAGNDGLMELGVYSLNIVESHVVSMGDCDGIGVCNPGSESVQWHISDTVEVEDHTSYGQSQYEQQTYDDQFQTGDEHKMEISGAGVGFFDPVDSIAGYRLNKSIADIGVSVKVTGDEPVVDDDAVYGSGSVGMNESGRGSSEQKPAPKISVQRELNRLLDRRSELEESVRDHESAARKLIGGETYDDIIRFLRSVADSEDLGDDDALGQQIQSYVFGRISYEKAEVVDIMHQILYLESELVDSNERIKVLLEQVAQV